MKKSELQAEIEELKKQVDALQAEVAGLRAQIYARPWTNPYEPYRIIYYGTQPATRPDQIFGSFCTVDKL